MNASIVQIIGVLPHHETDHTLADLSQLIGTVEYEVEWPNGEREILFTGLRPGENNAWNLKVIEAAQSWLNAGGAIPEWSAPAAEDLRARMPPLTARQFRLALVQSGRTLDQVDSAIAQIADDIERANAQIEWEYATQFERLHPLIVSLSGTLGFSPEDVDTLWQEALSL
ncbi:hypothetical protein [Labrenzia sp. OB1]|uniref:hypothetical protein n=1 Tax=Labrenzia sp. OB1 TaxID=1561204 RepID=UPI000839136B|nr:hypothetical protein [Labrenzia sp. OB1]